MNAEETKNPFSPRRAVERSAELNRILGLPRRQWEPRGAEYVQKLTEYLRQPHGTQTLRPVQAAALVEMHDQRGLLMPAAVGAGKTAVSLLGFVVLEARRPLLLMPAKLIAKTYKEAHEYRKNWIVPGFIRIESYEKLGRAQHASMLEDAQPDVIICDEVHRLRNPGAACTRRVGRYLKAHPEVVFVGLSGTVMKRSINDYSHLVAWALRDKSPAPLTFEDRMAWGMALDEKRDGENRLAPGALIEFCTHEEKLELGRAEYEDALGIVRRAYRRRVTDTPGIVATDFKLLGTSLRIENVRINVPTDTATGAAFWRALESIRGKWERPDGEPLMDGFEVWRHLREISLGFFYRWSNNHSRYVECLTEILKRGSSATASIEQRILSGCARTTASDIDLERALKRRRFGALMRSLTDCERDMASMRLSTSVSWPNTKALATSAASGRSLTERDAFALITIIEQGASADYSALPVTERSVCWEILLTVFPTLFATLETAIEASRPPVEWRNARKQWTWFVREILRSNRREIDSEAQVVRAIERGEYDRSALDEWRRVQPMYTPRTEAVWLDYTALDFCARWLRGEAEEVEKDTQRGICWVEHTEFGFELSRRTGLPYYHRGGMNAAGQPIEAHPPGEPLIASIASNAEGRNLQAWSNALVASPPQAGRTAEQLLGRLHRDGQTADEVSFQFLTVIPEQLDSLRRAIDDARAIQDLTGQPQKLVYGDVAIEEFGGLASDETRKARRR